MRSRGVSSYRTKKRSSNKLSKRISKRRVKRSYRRSYKRLNKRSNKRSNRRLNRKSFKRVSKRMRNNRKSYRRRGGAPGDDSTNSDEATRAIERAEKMVSEKRAEGERLMAQDHYVKAWVAFADAMASAKGVPNSHLVTDLPSLMEKAEDEIERMRTKVICTGSAFYTEHPRTGERFTNWRGKKKEVELFVFSVEKLGKESYTIYHQWDEILVFIKDLEDIMKKMDILGGRQGRQVRENDITFNDSYAEKFNIAYLDVVGGYFYNYIYSKGYDLPANRRRSIINKYFEVLSGKYIPRNKYYGQSWSFKTEQDKLDLLEFASETTYADHFNTFLYTKPEPTSTAATHDAGAAKGEGEGEGKMESDGGTAESAGG